MLSEVPRVVSSRKDPQAGMSLDRNRLDAKAVSRATIEFVHDHSDIRHPRIGAGPVPAPPWDWDVGSVFDSWHVAMRGAPGSTFLGPSGLALYT